MARIHKSRQLTAIKEAAHPPRVKNITAGRNKKGVREKIIIYPVGDFKVKEVKVSIVNARAEFIEEGMAVQSDKNNIWIYRTVHRNKIIAGAKITATATDYPGNFGQLEIILQ